jgi:hypothetical protein
MTPQSLIRLGGFAALTAGAVALSFNLGTIFGAVPATVDGYRALGTITLSLFALTGLYAAQAGRAGVLGLAGYVMGMLGLAGNVGLRFVYVLVAPILIAQYPEAAQAAGAGPLNAAMGLTFGAYAAGFIAFGLATWRAGVFPRWAGALIAVGGLLAYLLAMVPIPAGGMLVSAGTAWMGWTLVGGVVRLRTAAQPQAA